MLKTVVEINFEKSRLKFFTFYIFPIFFSNIYTICQRPYRGTISYPSSLFCLEISYFLLFSITIFSRKSFIIMKSRPFFGYSINLPYIFSELFSSIKLTIKGLNNKPGRDLQNNLRWLLGILKNYSRRDKNYRIQPRIYFEGYSQNLFYIFSTQLLSPFKIRSLYCSRSETSGSAISCFEAALCFFFRIISISGSLIALLEETWDRVISDFYELLYRIFKINQLQCNHN